MFAFDLPKHATIKVELPTGGDAVMIHLGGGRFVSNIPPLVLAGVSATEGSEVTGLPVGWDSGALPADVHPAVFAFDVAGAARSVDEAAAAGDAAAQEVLEKMRFADQQLAAMQAVGMVQAASEVQEAAA